MLWYAKDMKHSAPGHTTSHIWYEVIRDSFELYMLHLTNDKNHLKFPGYFHAEWMTRHHLFYVVQNIYLCAEKMCTMLDFNWNWS